jgi:hypothetical protein
MSSQFQTFGGNPIQPAYPGGINLALTSSISLAWPIQFQNTNNIVYYYMNITPNANGYTITLPDATLSSPWQSFIVNNPSAFSFEILRFDGSLLFTSTAGSSEYIILTNNTTQAGVWLTQPWASGGSSVTSVSAVSTSTDLVITGSPITSAGTLTFSFADDLASIISFGANVGVVCHTALNTFTLRNVAGTNNQIGIVNSDGVAGDITISLASNISGITSIQVNNLLLQTNTISTTVANQNLILSPNGTGLVEIQGGGARIDSGSPLYFYADNGINYTAIEGGAQTVNYNLLLPTVAPNIGQVLYISGQPGAGIYQAGYANVTTFGGPSTVHALTRFLDTIGSLENSTVLLDDVGNLTNINSAMISNITIGGTGGNLPNTIYTSNVNGNLILAPNGSGEVQSNNNLSVLNNSILKIFTNGVNYTGLQSPAGLGQISTYVFPTTAPTSGNIWIVSNSVTPYQLNNTYLPSMINLLYNGSFIVWQRGTSFTNATYYPDNNLQYCADRWKLLSNGNDIASVSRVAGPTNLNQPSSPYAWQFTVTGGAQKFGMLQILPFSSSENLINSNLTLSLIANGAGTTTLKYALLYWTGAADAPTTNPISAWGATGTSPTLVANWNYVSAATLVNLTGQFNIYGTSGLTVPAGTNNLAVMVWCDSTAGAAGNTMTVTCVNLTPFNYYIPYYPVPFSVELIHSKRFYQKDLPYAVAAGTANQGSSKGVMVVSPINAAVNIPTTASPTVIYGTVVYELEMNNAITPTITIYPLTTVTNTGRVSDNTGTDQAANTGVVPASGAILGNYFRGFSLQNTSGANLTTTGFLTFHYTVEAEF